MSHHQDWDRVVIHKSGKSGGGGTAGPNSGVVSKRKSPVRGLAIVRQCGHQYILCGGLLVLQPGSDGAC